MNPSFSIAQADVAAGQPTKRIVRIAKPQDGQAIAVPLAGETTLDFTAVAAEAITLIRVGDRLVVLFDNQATVTIAPAFDAAGQWRDGLTFEVPGRELAGADFATLFPVTSDLSVLPAAGALPGFAAGGHFPGPGAIEALGDGRGPLALVDPTDLGPAFPTLFPTLGSEAPPAPANGATETPNTAPHILSNQDSGAVREAATPSQIHGVVTFSDPDAADTHTTTVTADDTGYLGHLTATVTTPAADGPGAITWNFTADNAELDFLTEGETRTQTYTVTVEDGRGGSDTTQITITITGTNDQPAITGELSGTVKEDAQAPASGVMTTIDADAGQSSVQAVTTAKTSDHGYGSFTVTSDGHWVYTLNDHAPGIQELPDDASLTDSFTVWSQDGSVSQVVTIDIRGRNDGATIAGDSSGSVREDTGTPVSGTLTVDDIDTGESVVRAVTVATLGDSGYGRFTVTADGRWTYTLDDHAPGIQELPEDAPLTDSFTVWSQDGTASQVVTIDIRGSNDDATITGDVSGTVREDAHEPASGVLTAVDTDTGQSAMQPVTTATLSDHGYGSFTVTADGHWVYTLNDNAPGVQELPEDATLTDSFTVWSQDGSVSQTVTVTIRGSNDIASIAVPSGPVSVLSDGFESGFAPRWTEIGTASIGAREPTEGDHNARIVGGDEIDAAISATDDEIEALLRLAAGALDAVAEDHSAIDGSAIATQLNLAAGTYTLSFDWRYQAGDTYGSPWNDFAFMSIGGVVYVLTDVATVGDYGDSGWQHTTITLNLGGATTLGFGAINTGDEWLDGALLVDHVVLTGTQLDGDSATVTDDSGTPVHGVLRVSDIDTGEALLRTVTAGVSQYGSYTVAGDGTWTYALDDSNDTVNRLGAGALTTDTFTVISLDGTATHDVTITIQGANDAPTGTDVGKAIVEEGTATFVAGDFGFSDIDTGDTLGGVKITALPTDGALKLNGVAVTAGTVVAAADLSKLVFVPVNTIDDYTTTFTVQVVDQHGAADPTPRTVTIAVDADNDAPNGGAVSVSAGEDSIAAGFAAFNFGFTDPDRGDTFTQLKISSLPAAADGTLVLFDPNSNTRTPITADTVLTKAQLEFIQFVPANKEASYDATFTVQVQDSHGAFDPTPETVTIHVTADNDAPSIGALSNIISEDASGFSADLLANASDIDSPNLTAVNIPAEILTTDGRHLVAGLDYTITGSTFALTDHGFALFQNLATGYSDSFVLTYGVSDGSNTRNNTLTVTVNGANEAGETPAAPAVVGEISGLFASISTNHYIMTHPTESPLGNLPTTISYAIPADAIVVGNSVTWSMQVIYSSLQGTVAFNNSTNTISYNALPDTVSGMAILRLTATDAWGQSVVTYTTVSALDDGVQGFNDVYVAGNVPGAAGIIGGDGNDSISQSSGSDNEANILIGNGGDDYLVSNADHIENGDDAVYGGAGNDILFGGAGNDFLSGGDGNDRLTGGAGNDAVRGGAGDDQIYIAGGDAAADLLIDGGTGSDRLFIGALSGAITPTYAASAQLAGFGPANSIETITSVSTTDSTLQGTSGANTFDFLGTVLSNVDVDMGGGNDRVRTAVTHTNDDHTTYNGGDGTDTIVLNFTSSQIEEILADTESRIALRGFLLDATVGLDLSDTSWNASVTGFEAVRIGLAQPGSSGMDISGLFGSNPGSLTLPTPQTSGTTGADLLIGDDGADSYSGDSANDVILGRAGNDELRGDGGNDLLLGGDGNDTLAGGAGEDVLLGGAGADTFRLESPLDTLDHILDFDRAAGDRIDILASAFGLTAGNNVGVMFGSSATANAATANERFHFDTSTHTLYYDSDGSGAAAAIALARLENGANLQSGDLHLI